MQLIELYLCNLNIRLKSNEEAISTINRNEINRMMKAEKFLCNNLFEHPPSLKNIANNVEISEAKLKSNFKQVYNLAPHQHFQKKRMLLARDLLLTKKNNIKTIAAEFGFSNQQNFSIAFKKEFGILPSQIKT